MNKRIKAISDIATREEFERVIDQTVQLQITKERIELRLDERMLAIRKDLKPELDDLGEKMETNVIRAEKYAEEHREELLPKKRKTAETTFAFFGFRTGNPTLVLLSRKWTWAKVIEAIKTRGGWKYLIQVKESVDKDIMKRDCDDALLAEFGTRVEQREVFFVDPKRDPADPQRLVSEPKAA